MFFAPGSDVTKFLDRFVRGLENLPLTTGDVSGLPWIHLRRKRKPPRTKPSLLFSGLPDPSSNNTQSRYPTSDAILQLIASSTNTNNIVPIFGVIGCGLTRGMIELLSRRWGFYFNASCDDLGSDDILTLIDHIGCRLDKDLETNNRQARTITYFLLLSRLIILQYCLTIPGSYQTFTSARWTILQTCSHVFNSDVFNQLFLRLRNLLPVYPTPLTETDLEKAVQEELQVTRGSLIEHGIQGGLPSFTDRDTLLVVLDEAQILGEIASGRFKSMSMDPEAEKSGRPLLNPILWGFRNISRHDLTLITCGTELSIYRSDWAVGSGSFTKPAGSLTGKLNGFDYLEFPSWTGRESIEAYVADLRCLLPTEDAKQGLDRLLLPEAFQAISERLVGRYHPAVAAIEKIIASGDPDAWQDAVDDMEERLVSYEYCNLQGNLCHEIFRLENRYRKNLSISKEFRDLVEVLRSLLFQKYMFGANKLVLQKAVPELMDRALGRIKVVDGVARTVLDEPFVLKAAQNYFKMRDTGFMNTMDWWIKQSDRGQAHGYAWELMMMSVLTEAFKTRAFSDWPHDPSISSQSAKLAGNAKIVGLGEQELQRGISHEHISIENFMEAHVRNSSMHDGRAVPPFFFPMATPSGPDIIFYIQVNNKLFPVFVQLKLRQTLYEKDAQSALKTVSAESVKQHAADLHKYCPTDKTCISMVIAYPAKVVAKLVPRPDPDFEDLKQVVINVDETNFGAIFPQSHVEFLDSIKTPLKRQTEME